MVAFTLIFELVYYTFLFDYSLQWDNCVSLAHNWSSTRAVLTWLAQANPVNVGMPNNHIHKAKLMPISQMVA